MPNNVLVTGPPRSGKTTVIRRTVERLERDGFQAGGIVAPERREGGTRVGFDIVDLMSGRSEALARVERVTGPSVGKYRVNVPGLDSVCETAFTRAFPDADFVVVDEIAPMEVFSDEFLRGVDRALDSTKPLIAAIHARSKAGFIGTVRSRTDVDRYEVTDSTRDHLPEDLAAIVRNWLESQSK